ncbi:60 kDa chaperonin 1 [bacterium AB1]|nr:60 kDa chaperonin 1 [bacterium AB1]
MKNNNIAPFLHGKDMQKKFYDTIINISNIVANTLGPLGKYAAIEKTLGRVYFTKDGVTVLKYLNSNDRYENMFINAMKDVCNKTNNKVGDGTTTTLVILKYLIQESYKLLNNQCKPRGVSQGIVYALECFITNMKEQSIKATEEDLKNIAIIASGNDVFLGNMLYEAIKKIDPKYGYITVEESKSVDTSLEITDGSVIYSGYASSHFIVTKDINYIEYENSLILIFEETVSSIELVVKCLEYAISLGQPIVFMAPDFDTNVLNNLIINNYQKILKVSAIKINKGFSSISEMYKDYACVVGGNTISQSYLNIQNIKIESILIKDYVGSCKKIIIYQDKTLIINGFGDKEKMNQRCLEISSEIDSDDVAPDRSEELKERYSRIKSSIAVIRVGAATGGEVSEIKDRVIDAVSAVKSASYYGVSVGGGVTLLKMSVILKEHLLKIKCDYSEDFVFGYLAFCDSLSSITKQLLINSELSDVESQYEKILQKNIDSVDQYIGYEAFLGEFCNLKEKNIFDTTQALIVACQGAVSICKMFLMSNTAILKEIQNNIAPNNYFS